MSMQPDKIEAAIADLPSKVLILEVQAEFLDERLTALEAERETLLQRLAAAEAACRTGRDMPRLRADHPDPLAAGSEIESIALARVAGQVTTALKGARP